jgi:hypothetical protein
LRSAKPSVRPSAFGPPRTPSLSAPANVAAEAPEELTFEPTPSGTRRRIPRELQAELDAERGRGDSQPVPAPPSFSGDLEELLPLVNPKKSLPREPSLPALPERPSQRTGDAKRARMSVLIFAGMLLFSAFPLLRYAGVFRHASDDVIATAPVTQAGVTEQRARQVPSVQAGAHVASNAVPAAEPAPNAVRAEQREREAADAERVRKALEAAEASLPTDRVAAADQLMAAGLKALSAGDRALAEALLGRALERDDDNPRAHFALAQIRVYQGNFEGAEGWLTLAIQKRPRRAEYHALYAKVLEQLGRSEEAAAERARAQTRNRP